MKIVPIEDDDTDFALVVLKEGKYGTKYTPHCIKHGAMNKITSEGVWRCIHVPAVQEVREGNAIGYKQIDNTCKAGCKEIENV